MRTLMMTLVIAAFALATAPVMASECPRLIAQIDQKLEEEALSSDAEEEIKRLRDEGEKAHEDGDHDTAESKLGEALQLFADDAYDVDVDA